MPKEIFIAIQRECSAVLLGALGDPRVPSMEHARDILFGLRFGLDLYANIRPVKALGDRVVPLKGRGKKDVDFVVFRENTEGVYVGVGGQVKRGTPDEIAINEDVNTRKGVERIIRAGLRVRESQRASKRVHMADKSNAMRHAHELWLRVFDEVRREYADLQATHVYIDALCLYLVQDPSQFDVVVTNNLFGDIVTDLGAALPGWPGHGRQRQRAPRRSRARGAVRARARLGPPSGREERREPVRGPAHGGHAARAPGLARRRDPHRGHA
jgi:3-isopropylmalate dehydrogenase